MKLVVAQGEAIRLPAEFYAGDIPADPSDPPQVVVLDPSRRSVVVTGAPVREARGRYHVTYDVQPDAPLGVWKVRWTAIIEGEVVTGEDPFEVTPADPVRSPVPDSDGLGAGDAANPPDAQPRTVPLPPPEPPASHAPAASPGRIPASGSPPPAPARTAPGDKPAAAQPHAGSPAGAPAPQGGRARAGAPPKAGSTPAAPPAAAPQRPAGGRPGPGKHIAAATGRLPGGRPETDTPPPRPAVGKKRREPAPAAGPRTARREPAAPRPPEPAPSRQARPAAVAEKAGGAREVLPASAPLDARRRRRPVTREMGKRNRRLVLALLVCFGAVTVAVLQIGRQSGAPSANLQSFEDAEKALREGRIDQARTHYMDIILRDPDNKTAHFDLGMLAHMQNRPAEAEDYYMRALKADPEYLPALYNLAVLKESQGRTDEAILLYRRIMDTSPENAPSRFNLGLILYNQKGQPEEGRRLIEQAVRLDPTLASRAAEAFK